MRPPFFKIVIGALLLAPVLFLLSFIVLRLAFIMLIVGVLYRLFAGLRMHRHNYQFGHNYNPAFEQQAQFIADERFDYFKAKFQERYDYHHQQNDYRIVIK